VLYKGGVVLIFFVAGNGHRFGCVCELRAEVTVWWRCCDDRCVDAESGGLEIPQMTRIFSGQIIATSHGLTPKGGLVKEIPLFNSGKSRLVFYYNLARYLVKSPLMCFILQFWDKQFWETLLKLAGSHSLVK